MRTYFQWASLVIFVGWTLAALSIEAQPIYLNDPTNGFIAHYTSNAPNTGSQMGNCFSCYMCHSAFPENADNLTKYATDWRNAWVALEPARVIDEGTNASSAQAFKNIESNDSDGDGASNLAEITAISNPGDPTSTPTAAGTCPNSPGTSAGGGATALSNIGGQYNANALNSKCGFQSGAGMLKTDVDPVQQAEVASLFFLPLLTLFALRRKKHFRRFI